MTLRQLWIVTVSSLEQVVGAALSTVVGVMIPMLQLLGRPEMPSAMQGLVGAMGLIGIACGSLAIGGLIDRQGYLRWFRICPLMIVAGALLCVYFDSTFALIAGLFIAGAGVGGGYSLDSAYISELMPKQLRQRMVGVAKGTCSLGFLGAAFVCWLVLHGYPEADLARSLMWIVASLGIITFALRIHWAESPKWLLQKGRVADAKKAFAFFGVSADESSNDDAATANSATTSTTASNKQSNTAVTSERSGRFVKNNIKRIIFSGVPWACEGLGVYGFGVFLPVLVMALGLESLHTGGMQRVVDSVEITAIVNFFILPGFIIGLVMMSRVNHVKMLSWGFVLSAIGLAVLYVGDVLHAPDWVLIVGFVVFEVSLNAGPHLITFIIPSMVYPVSDRGTGTGIAAMIGKVGAVLGVFIMPVMIRIGGASLVLVVSMAVMIAGAVISIVYGRRLGLDKGTV